MNDTDFSEYEWTIEYLHSTNMVKVVAKNTFSVQGHSKMVEEVISQDFWKSGMNLLIDDRKVEFKKTDLDLIKTVSENFSDFKEELGRGKTAILMGSLGDYVRGRQFDLLTDDKVYSDIQIFMDEEKALDWLNS